MTKYLSEKAKKFLNRKPTYIGTVGGYRFYEHPAFGDEAHLVMITPGGRVKSSGLYDLPTITEIE